MRHYTLDIKLHEPTIAEPDGWRVFWGGRYHAHRADNLWGYMPLNIIQALAAELAANGVHCAIFSDPERGIGRLLDEYPEGVN